MDSVRSAFACIVGLPAGVDGFRFPACIVEALLSNKREIDIPGRSRLGVGES